MHSLRELYKIGNGPSSSHTIGPKKAAQLFKKRYPQASFIKVVLYGSLAMTGKGHLTDYIIHDTLANVAHEVIFDYYQLKKHPNTLEFKAYLGDSLIGEMLVYSVGGGSIEIEGENQLELTQVYPLNKFSTIAYYCTEHQIRLCDYVMKYEGEGFYDFLEEIYQIMMNSIHRGLTNNALLPGDLRIRRKAKDILDKKVKNESFEDKNRRFLCAYAYAVSEENASGGEIVTAPTCGASGVLPAVIKYIEETTNVTHKEVLDALSTAGLIGNLVKFNASISGAEAGCQAEIGTACSMAAAFISEIKGASIEEIESSAEIALEHHLGLTCDPIKGYVQIPCIERNAVAAMRSVDSAMLASNLDCQETKISFDLVCKTMLETGKDINSSYRETAEGGLAKNYR